MTSTYVNDLRLNEMATGDASGSWGTVTNTNLELISEAFSYGTEAITENADTHNTLIANGGTDPGRSLFLKYTGALDSACTITISAGASTSDFTISKVWFIHNATTGGEDIIITSGSGANVTIPAGHTKCIYTDGAGSGGAVVDGFAGLSAGANLYVKNPATTDNSTANIYLQTAEADIAVNDVIGKINFQAPDEGTGTDAILIAAAIQAISEGDFSASNNATSLAFMTGASEAATTKMTLSSAGNLTLTSTTASTSSTTGSLIVGGGVGIAADLFVGDDLDVAGDAVIDLTLTQTSAAHFGADIDLLQGNHIRFKHAAGGTIRASISAESDDDLQFNTGSSETARMTIDTDGLVGIGTDSPTRQLVLYGSAPYMAFQNSTTGAAVGDGLQVQMAGNDAYVINYESGNLYLATSGTSALQIDASGNIIIANTGGTLYTTTAGASNFRAGVNAGDAIVSGGNYNTVVGDEAGTGITTGLRNTFVGASAGDVTTTAADNVGVGHNALGGNILGSDSVAIGKDALEEQNPAGSSIVSMNNTAVGTSAGQKITTGTVNTYLGSKAGLANIVGHNNVALGFNSLLTDSHGSQSTAVGVGALQVQDNGTTATNFLNTAVGYNAGVAVLTSTESTLLGANAGAVGLTTGSKNTFVGSQAGLGVSTKLTGDGNTAIGRFAGGSLQGTAAGNTLIGMNCGDDITTGDTNIVIGYNLDVPTAGGDSQLNIGGWIQGLAGDIGIGASGADIDAKLHVVGSALVGSGSANTTIDDSLSTGLDIVCGSGTKALQVWDDNVTGTPRLSVLRSGNVGIGIETPDQLLQVKGVLELQATNSTNGWVIVTHTDNTLLFNYNGAGNDEVILDTSGNLLVGTSTLALSSSTNSIVVGSNAIHGVRKTFTNLSTSDVSFGFSATAGGTYMCSIRSVGNAVAAFSIGMYFDNSTLGAFTTAMGACTAGGLGGTISGMNNDTRTYTITRNATSGVLQIKASALASGDTIVSLVPFGTFG